MASESDHSSRSADLQTGTVRHFPGRAADPVVDETIARGTLVDSFLVVRRLGRGGMGEVYLARDTRLGRKVALKLIRSEVLGSPEAVDRFLQEARTTALFNHPHIVTVYAAGTLAGRPYLALEFLEGQTLADLQRERRAGVWESLRIALDIAEALCEAHRHQVLHRDLKPSNVLLPKDGRLRVVDFGLAKALSMEDVLDDQIGPAGSSPGVNSGSWSGPGLRGSPPYMAPEQWLERPCSGATDIWALGVILWELLAGKHPYAECSLAELYHQVSSACPAPPLEAPPEVPAVVVDLAGRCLNKDPQQRPSATQVSEVLQAAFHRGALLAADRSPFRGLLPFSEEQADLFFGRDEEVAAFLERLRQQAVLPVVGPSGAGKSSFVQAGVIPRLREQGRWLILSLRPGPRPLQALAARLLHQDPASPAHAVPALTGVSEEQLRHEIVEAPGLLALRLQALAEREQARVLLFVDQLEELHTLVEEEPVRQRFMEAICSAADDPAGSVRVIFTLRDDFLGRSVQGTAAREALSKVTVLRSLGREALTNALVKPVRAVGYEYDDPELPDDMAAAVCGEAAALPLLQFAAQALWDQRDTEKRHLTRAAYQRMNGVGGSLAHHADAVVDGLPAGEARLAQELLLRLVTPEKTRRVVPRREILAGLEVEAAPALDRLCQSRLVQVRKSRVGEEEPEIELAHESLIRSWGRFARWLDESPEDTAFVAEVTRAAALWTERGRQEADLWQGAALQDSLRRAERLEGVTEPVAQFLAAGRSRAQRHVRRRRRFLGASFALLSLVAAGAVSAALVASHRERAVRAQKQQEQQMLSWCREAAAKVVPVMEGWVRTGALTEQQIFAEEYSYIPDTDPPKFHTAYDTLSDRDIGPVQEVYFAKAREIAYVVLVDQNGYLPTHQRRYSLPLTGNKQVDLMGNRTKRKFDDPIGLAAAQSTEPYLIQTYARDSGELMKSVSVPIFPFGKHWGALRLGFNLPRQ
jgi:serine/threonine protein kinase